jgi:hypothetical protein
VDLAFVCFVGCATVLVGEDNVTTYMVLRTTTEE